MKSSWAVLGVSALGVAALAGSAVLGAPPSPASAAEVTTTETIVLVRHGEKPPPGLGQLNCQGLNRALALPWVIQKQFGRPAAIFAPNPSEQKTDSGKPYDYVRPLATIEPTAIAFGLPIHAEIGQARFEDLRRVLDGPLYRDGLVLVAWEHRNAALLARSLLEKHGGDAKTVPEWKGSDFDSIYIVRIERSASAAKASFELGHEGLDGQNTTCPGAP